MGKSVKENYFQEIPAVSAAFAPYRVRPFEFAPTLYRVRPHTFRVRPHQVEFAPRLSHV